MSKSLLSAVRRERDAHHRQLVGKKAKPEQLKEEDFELIPEPVRKDPRFEFSIKKGVVWIGSNNRISRGRKFRAIAVLKEHAPRMTPNYDGTASSLASA